MENIFLIIGGVALFLAGFLFAVLGEENTWKDNGNG